MTLGTPRLHVPHEATVRRFRPDVQGLRAVAVLLVVLYHAQVPGVRGGYVGVDVFFVISGFLITGQLLREVAERGRISFANFYLKRVRRLLPPAAIVVVATLLVARVWAPPLQVQSLGSDALFTLIYGLNYRLAAQGVDYQNESGPSSPLQHYWSLAVEEQFYVLWPLLIMLIVLVARRRWRYVLPWVFGLGGALSLYLSETLVHSNAPLAYFSLQSRAWELAAGALLAVSAGRLVATPGWIASLLGWTGLTLIITTGLLYTDSVTFPGLPAAVPVAATVLVIAAGCRRQGVGPESLVLSRRPMQGLGRVSYSWYLWHWPLVTLAPLIAPNYAFGWVRNLEMMVIALWLAVLTHYLVEKPVQRPRFRRMSWAAWGFLASGATASVAALTVVSLPPLVGSGAPVSTATYARSADAEYLRTVQAQLRQAAVAPVVPSNLTPDLATARGDYPPTTGSREHCQAQFLVVEQGACESGDLRGSRTVVLFGDSHMEQWQPAFSEAGRREGWRVVNWTKAACPIAQLTIRNPQLNREYTECTTWRNRTIERIHSLQPDLVILGQSDSVIGKAVSDQDWANLTLATANRLKDAGLRVNYMLDTVYPAVDVPTCVSDNLQDVRRCEASGREPYVALRHEVVQATLTRAGLATVDPTPWQCAPTGPCPVIVGNLLAYRDSSHITATFSRWLAPLVQPLLQLDPPTTKVDVRSPVADSPVGAVRATQGDVDALIDRFALSVDVSERRMLLQQINKLAKTPGIVIP